jgi:hypothetical protein
MAQSKSWTHLEDRVTVVDLDGYIVSHFQTDEAYVAGLDRSTYRD